MRSKLSQLQPWSFSSNVGNDLCSAMDQLRKDNSLIIRQADKGSCIVIMDTSKYIEEGLQHLSDTSLYKKLDKDRTLETAHKANWALQHHSDIGTVGRYTQVSLYKCPEDARTQEMYFLRKVHKNSHNIRPIVSCSSGPTEKISGYVCNVLTPHLQDVKSLVTNSQQVVQTLESLVLSNHQNVTLVSLDIEALYLSIPQAVGIEMVLQRVFPTSPPQATYNGSKNLIRDLLRVIIRDNCFRFHDTFFLQTKGVAMGTKCAPPFANLFLGSLEEKALDQWKGTHPLLWLRFLDDILMLWPGNNTELQLFLGHLNNMMYNINFTMSQDKSAITFLDLKGSRFNQTWYPGHQIVKKTNKPSELPPLRVLPPKEHLQHHCQRGASQGTPLIFRCPSLHKHCSGSVHQISTERLSERSTHGNCFFHRLWRQSTAPTIKTQEKATRKHYSLLSKTSPLTDHQHSQGNNPGPGPSIPPYGCTTQTNLHSGPLGQSQDTGKN